MKKIIFFAYDLNVGGIEKSLVNLTNSLVDFYEVNIVLEKKEGTYLDDLSPKITVIEHKVSNFKIIPIRKIINYTRRILFTLKHKNKYDFSCAYATYLYSANKLSKICSQNNAIFIHNDYSNIYNKEEMLHFFNSRKVEKYRKIIFVSNESRIKFCDYYPKLKEKCITINNLVNIEEITNKSKEKIEIEINSNDTIFAFVGRLDEHQKKISRLLECFKILINHNKNIKLWIIGGGDEYEKSKSFINTNQLENNIILIGKQSNPYKYLIKSNYLIITSDYEGFPVVFNEAAVLNKPILSTLNISDDFYDIEDGHGFLIPKDPVLMAKEIEKIINTKIQTKKMNFEEINKRRIESLKNIIENKEI